MPLAWSGIRRWRILPTWTSSPLSAQGEKLLADAKVNPVEGSLIGTVLNQGRRPFLWDENTDGDFLAPHNPRLDSLGLSFVRSSAEGYREILASGRIRHQMVIPFYTEVEPPQPLGYLHLINRRTSLPEQAPRGFTEVQADGVQAIGGLLAIAIENFRSRQREAEEREDITFLASTSAADSINTALVQILAFLNRKLESRVASLWVPIEDGFGPPESITKLLLRAVVVAGPESSKGQNSALERQLRERNLHTLSSSYVGRYLSQDPPPGAIHYNPDISNEPHCWSDLLQEIGTPKLVVVPIHDPMGGAPLVGESFPLRKVMAVLCLRPRAEAFVLAPEVHDRLRRVARHLGNLILETRLKRRFRQIDLLRQKLDTLQQEPISEFYRRLVELVREVMGAEACSLFLTHRGTDKLVLKASTAAKADVEEHRGKTERVKVEQLIDQPIFDTKAPSITADTFRERKAVLIYHTPGHSHFSHRFLEVTPTAHPRSLLAAPVTHSGDRPIGVLRCINQVRNPHLPPGFLQSDREFLALLTGIVSRFVENSQSTEVRRNFLNQLSHEFTTPLLLAQTHSAFLHQIVTGKAKTRDPEETVENLRDTLTHLSYLVTDIQQHFGGDGPGEVPYNFSAPVSIHRVVEVVRKPMLGAARSSRAIEIHGRTALAPELYVDRVRFQQVIYNLLQNAIKYSRYGGDPIWIAYDVAAEKGPTSGTREWHRIRVSNSGIGVPVGEEEIIFLAHERGSNVHFVASGPSGTGLGLAVARQIVERHGGMLRLERRDGPTVFAILFPKELEQKGPP